MKYSQFLAVLSLFFAFGINSVIGQSHVIADGAELKQVGDGYSFTEGPAVDPAGNVYFTDQPNDRILKWTPDGSMTTFIDGAGRSNGLYFDNEGNLLSCADEKNQLWKISPSKEVTVMVNDFEGKRLNGPNDLWVDKQGGIFFTDPFYKRDWWDHAEKEIEKENVYYLSPDGETLKIAASDFVRPNGIVGSQNGKILYVADINDKKTYSFSIGKDGTLSNRQLFTDMGSDGMTIDNKGNLYLTGKGVTVFDKKGQKIEYIPVDENWTANVCFGGPSQNTLFITAMGSVYTLDMKVHGVR